MKSLHLSRSTISVCLAGALLAGCNQSNIALPQSDASGTSTRSGQLRSDLMQFPAGGGSFGGGYSGEGSNRPCVNRGSFHNGHILFNGTGEVTFLGRSKESVHLNSFFYSGLCSEWSGVIHLISLKDPTETIVVAFNVRHTNTKDGSAAIAGKDPCNGKRHPYAVMGGTGKFATARGGGNVILRCSATKYSDHWSGGIRF